MRAARLHEIGARLQVEDVPDPKPGPDDVLVNIAYCGVCASDLHVQHGVTPSGPLPQILGHEAAGRVAVSTDGFQAGDWVAICPYRPCRSCPACTAGRENLCQRGQVFGVDTDGEFAEMIAAPADRLLRIPTGVDAAEAAVATDAVATAYHALRRAGPIDGRSVAVFGAGGVGAHGILLAKVLGAAWIAAVDLDPVARERALAFGADVAVDPTDGKPGRAVRKASGGGVDYALEFIGIPEVQSQAAKSIRPGGRVVMVGLTPDELRLLPGALLVSGELEVAGSFGYTLDELEDLFGMLDRGELDLSRSITHRLPLDDVNRALEMLATREGHPLRIVLEL